MRNIATLACAMLVFGVTVERSHADELPNLKDPTMVSAGHALFLEKQCAHCHGEDGTGGVNLTRRVLDAKGVFISIADGREKKVFACLRGGKYCPNRRFGMRQPTSCRSADQRTSKLSLLAAPLCQYGKHPFPQLE